MGGWDCYRIAESLDLGRNWAKILSEAEQIFQAGFRDQFCSEFKEYGPYKYTGDAARGLGECLDRVKSYF